MNAIEINHINKVYPDFQLQDICLSLPQGTILGLVGENGAGKTTLIKLIMNAISPDSGTIQVLGTDNQTSAFTALKEDIGIVLDEAYFPEVLTANNMASILRQTYQRWDDAQFQRYLKQFDLPENKAFKNFSRGMKMKLAIASALSHDPKLLVLDEATGGLDPIMRDEILDLFYEFTREPNHSILISSHIVSDLEKLCDYIAFLHKGRLVLYAEKDQLLEEYAILKLSHADREALPPEAIHGIRKTPYGTEVLVRREEVPTSFCLEHTTLEDIILFLTRKEASL